MLLRSKLLVGLVAVVIALSIAPSTFAQTNITVFPNGSAAEISTNRVADTFDPTSVGSGLLFSGSNLASASLSTATDIIITYPAAITSSTTLPTGNPISIQGQTGVFSGVVISTINYNGGIIRLTLPSQGPSPTTATGSFRLVGVRTDASVLPVAAVNASIALSSTSNNYILSTSSVTVIGTLAPGISLLATGPRLSTTTSTGTFTFLTNGGFSDNAGQFTLTEGSATLWRTAAQDQVGTNSSQIRLTFNNIPAGLTLNLTLDASSGGPTASVTTITTANNVTIISWNTALSMTAVDKLQVNVAASAPVSVTSLAATPSISVTATMYPIATLANDNTTVANGTPVVDTGFPRFVAADVGPLTIGNVVAATTTLLIPFGLVNGGYDTGMSIANTSTDPFGGAVNGGATAGTGSITVTLYPTPDAGGAGTAGAFTTSSTKKPGRGLSADGTLASGATWTVNFSELLSPSGLTAPFYGYAFLQANFLNAHGMAFIYNGSIFTSFTNVLVLPPVATGNNARANETGLNN